MTKVEDTSPLGRQSNGVYCIPRICNQVYIEESRRTLEIRLKQHRNACEKGMIEKSDVAEHTWENHHLIRWEETTVLEDKRCW